MGSLYVIVMRQGETVVAADSRQTKTRMFDGARLEVRDGVEKVHVIGPNTLFFLAGLDQTHGPSGDAIVDPASIAERTLKSHQDSDLPSIGKAFALEMNRALSVLSADHHRSFLRHMTLIGAETLLEAVFARPSEIVIITFRYFDEQGLLERRWEVDHKTAEQLSIGFLGIHEVLTEGWNDQSAILRHDPEFREMLNPDSLPAEVVAETLLKLGIQYAPSSKRQSLGWPIHLYRVDRGGVTRIR